MDSPINPAVFRFLFKATLGTLSAATLFSVLHQKYDMHAVLNQPLSTLRKAKTEEAKAEALKEILNRLQSDAVKKDSSSRLAALKNGAAIVESAKLEKSGSNLASFLTAIKVIVRVFGADAAGRRRLQQLGGYRVLLISLSTAYSMGLQEAMEEVAEALRMLTIVDDAEVVLNYDVPVGSEGTYALAHTPSTVKMLGILDPEGSTLFLSAITGIFANICTLTVGAVAVGRGSDGHSGMSYFLRLLDHPNRSVLEHVMLAIRYLTRAHVCQEELCTEDTVAKLAESFHVRSDPAVINSILTIILVMAGSHNHRNAFLSLLAVSTIPATLFDIWVKSPEAALRNRAEVICQLLSRMEATQSTIGTLMQRYRPQIEERHHKDQQEQQQKMQQQRYMQQMMMAQMGMDPSMG